VGNNMGMQRVEAAVCAAVAWLATSCVLSVLGCTPAGTEEGFGHWQDELGYVDAALGDEQNEPTLNGDEAEAGEGDSVQSASALTRKLAVVIYDPRNPANPNETVSSYFGFFDGADVAQSIRDKLAAASGGVANFDIRFSYRVNAFPLKQSGARYDWQSYIQCREDTSTCLDPDRARYAPLMNGTDTGVNLCALVQSGAIDEIWVMGSGYFGFDEFAWKTPGNALRYAPLPANPWLYRPYDLPDCGRPYFVMGFVNDHPPGLHSFGHRVESALALSEPAGGHWTRCNASPRREWTDFICRDGDDPGEASCGDVHYPPNGVFDYDYANHTPKQSKCNDWFRYPYLTGAKTNVSANTWRSSQHGNVLLADMHRSTGNSFERRDASIADEGYKLLPGGYSLSWHTGDFDRDGRTDLAKFFDDGGAWSVDVYFARLPNTFFKERWANRQGGYWPSQQWHSADFDGDGSTDFAKFWNHSGQWSADVHLSTGDHFAMQRWATKQGGYWGAQRWHVGDFNGDGRSDFAKFWKEDDQWTVDVHLSTGDHFAMQRWATKQGGYWDAQRWHVGDFNGDGRSDFAKFWNSNGQWTVDVHLSTGSSFVMQRWATEQGGYWDGQRWYVGDFNGDGRSDFAKFWSSDGQWTVDVHVSTGSSFVMQRWATKQGGYWDGQRWYVGDFNGDGRSDFAKFWNHDGYFTGDVHVSMGSNFVMQRWATKQGGYTGERRRFWFLGNFDGNASGRQSVLNIRRPSGPYLEGSYLHWWMNHIPRRSGAHPATWDPNVVILNNWWHYALCYSAPCP